MVDKQISTWCLLDVACFDFFCCEIILKIFLFADKCKRVLQEFYSEDDNGKKVFKYGAQLVSSTFIFLILIVN